MGIESGITPKNILNKNIEGSKPSLLKRIGQGVVAFGTTALTKSPQTGLIAGKAVGEIGNSNNIANAKVTMKVMEALYTGPGKINDSKLSMDYKAPIAGSQNEKLREAYLQGAKLISAAQGNDPSRFRLGVDFILSGSEQKKFDALVDAGLLGEMKTGIAQDALETRDSPLTKKSAAQIAYDDRVSFRAKESPKHTDPASLSNIGRASEKITANGQVMRTQADAYNQNRADDQSAASKRAGERSAAINNRDKSKQTAQEARDEFNASRADEIRTKHGGNKQTDSNGEDSGCFLTTAIVEHRGESDDGPTLTKLRHFRDTYLVDYPEEIKKYYSVAPKIVAAIPKNNPEWDWVGTQIDSAIQDIDNNMLDKAHKTYKNMVLKLETNWLN